MDQQNIDRLFREKLGQLEVTPSAKGWSQVEKQIRPKKTPIVYWVAASVSLLFISWMVWPEATEPTLTTVASEVNYPVNQELPSFELPVIKTQEEDKVKSLPQPVQKTQNQVIQEPQFAVNETKDEKSDIIKDVAPEIEELNASHAVAEVELEEPVILEEVKDEVEKPTFRAVKITYIASAGKSTKEDVQKNDSTGVLKKFIAFTEKIDPGDMLADIKTAKDNLLNGGLKNKKDRSSL
ncbi:hypothetical protein [Ekhidna sp. To15]|uniref:hypothetical protein n=1 Tax=Ekhidna sp. To15 TaxID=3395267 RepID=UPI003F51E0BE